MPKRSPRGAGGDLVRDQGGGATAARQTEAPGRRARAVRLRRAGRSGADHASDETFAIGRAPMMKVGQRA